MRADRSIMRMSRISTGLVAALALAGCSVVQPKKAPETVASRQISAAMLALPEASLESGRYDDALRQYQSIVATDPANSQAKLGIAEVHLAMGNAQSALELFTDLTNDESLRARGLQGQGLALLKMGQRDSATKALSDATVADAKLWRAWNALGALADGQQKWADADRAYQQALAVQPDSAIVHNNNGFSHLMRRDFDGAVESFQKALRAEPTLDAARMNLRIALAMQGRYREAIAGAQGKEAPAVLNNVGVAAMSRGDYKNAEAYLVQALDASPSQYEMASKNLQQLKMLQDHDHATESPETKR